MIVVAVRTNGSPHDGQSSSFNRKLTESYVFEPPIIGRINRPPNTSWCRSLLGSLSAKRSDPTTCTVIGLGQPSSYTVFRAVLERDERVQPSFLTAVPPLFSKTFESSPRSPEFLIAVSPAPVPFWPRVRRIYY